MTSVNELPPEEGDGNGEGGTGDKKLNPFDPRRLRYRQSRSEGPTTRKIVSAAQVRKPNRQEFFRVHPSSDMRIETLVLDFKAEGIPVLENAQRPPRLRLWMLAPATQSR